MRSMNQYPGDSLQPVVAGLALAAMGACLLLAFMLLMGGY